MFPNLIEVFVETNYKENEVYITPKCQHQLSFLYSVY